MLTKSLRCGGKAAGDPIYKHLGFDESRILLSVCICGIVHVLGVNYVQGRLLNHKATNNYVQGRLLNHKATNN